MATTLYRLAEECLKILSGGEIQSASNISISECKISICQVANQLLKAEHFSVNEKMGEKIDNGAILGLYENIAVSAYSNGRSQATLPVKPIKLPRNMGVFSVFLSDDPSNEFIPLQMGQMNMLKSQPMINELLGQVGYECFGLQMIFSKDLTLLFPNKTISTRLAILDFSEYGDWDVLPLTPELEWGIKNEVVKLYSGVGIGDRLVDVTDKSQQGVPIKQQQQSQ
jgi:hypothetical protein